MMWVTATWDRVLHAKSRGYVRKFHRTWITFLDLEGGSQNATLVVVVVIVVVVVVISSVKISKAFLIRSTA